MICLEQFVDNEGCLEGFVVEVRLLGGAYAFARESFPAPLPIENVVGSSRDFGRGVLFLRDSSESWGEPITEGGEF